MEDKAPYYASCAYDSEHAQAFKKFCKKIGIKQKDFIPLAVEYFQKTGVDPRDPPEQITNDFQQIIKRSENRLIGFVKTQDKTSAEQHSKMIAKLEEVIEHISADKQTTERLIKIITS